MKVVNVRDIYTVDTISKTNNKAWTILLDVVEKDPVDTLFDFRGIELIEPWNNDMFKKFLQNEYVYIKLYSSEKVAKTIELACLIGGLKTGRVFNENIVAPPTLSKEEKKILDMGMQLQDYFRIEDNVGILDIYKRFDQIGSINTVNYINKAIELFVERTGIKNIVLNTESMPIQKNIIEQLSNIVAKLYVNGITLKVVSNDKDIANRFNLHQYIAYKNLTDKEKYMLVKEILHTGIVGMLTKYKKSRALDEFGRYGNGEPVSCRAAIFLGFGKTESGAIGLKFRAFNGNTFYTKLHWAIENDGEELRKLQYEDILIPINDIGIFDKFLGTRYHFSLPIQYYKEDSSQLYTYENGKLKSNMVTIPMRIKMVLDDWGIKYDEESLNMAIIETENILRQQW